MRDRRTKPLLAFIIVLALLYVVIYILPRASAALRPSYTLEYGELKITDSQEGYIVKDETVYFAAASGIENRYIKEGRLVRTGTRIMKLEGDYDDSEKGKYRRIREDIGKKGVRSKDFRIETEGVVSYNADGNESKFTSANIDKKKKDDFKKLDNDDNIELAREKVAKGDPVFKIVDRSGWYIVTYIPKESKKRYAEGEKISLTIDESATIMGQIQSMTAEDDEIKVVIRTDYYYKGFTTTRVVDVELVASDEMGLIVRNSSIGKEKGHSGVYVRQKTGEYKFTRVNVIATDGKESVVSRSYFYDEKGNPVNTVRTYDEVLRKAPDK